MSEHLNACKACGGTGMAMPPPEPPVGTWVKDRHGGVTMRHAGGGWAPPGFAPLAKWEPMWLARGPLVECGPWGVDLEEAPA